MFITALFTIARTWKQPRCPSADEWIRKLWYTYTMDCYSAVKKNAFESVQVRSMRQGAQGWCTRMTLRDGIGVQDGEHMYPYG